MPEVVRSRARVALTIEFDVGSSWNADCTLAQVHKQAAETALGIVASLAAPGRDKNKDATLSHLSFIGTPQVHVVTTTLEGTK